MPKDVYVQPNAPDPVLDAEHVLRLARQHAPEAQSVTAVDESGGEARTYLIDDRLIFKTQRPQQLRPRTSLEKEVFFLKQIDAVLPHLSVPRVLGTVHDSAERVALHSNPYHEHTFVDPDTGAYVGLIDFGDAYISHPTFDLRRWRTRPEREALMAGYTADEPVDDQFLRTWRVAQVLGDLGAVVSNMAVVEDAMEDIARLFKEM